MSRRGISSLSFSIVGSEMRCMHVLSACALLLGEPRCLSAAQRKYYVRWCVVQWEVCAVIKRNYLYFNALAICPIAPASLEGGFPCFFGGVGMDEIRCVECRLLI